MRHRLTAHRLHRWAGLGAGLWLAVLGLSGFVLDHHDWMCLWQSGVPAAWVPARIVHQAEARRVQFYRFVDGHRRLAGGRSGVWWSDDGGRHWEAIRGSRGRRLPPVYQVLHDGDAWLLATADGLWSLANHERVARPWRFSGRAVTALAPRDARRLWVVLERSELWSLAKLSGVAERVPLPEVPRAALPPGVDLSRLMHDLHFGRGLFRAPWSLLWSDAAGLGMVILPLSGFLYWWLPRRFRARRRAGQPVSSAWRRQSMRWLYRLHGPLAGLLVVVPLIYLALTGVLLDHAAGLRPWMKSVHLFRNVLPPVYTLTAWQGEIRAVLGWPQQPDRVSLGTRLGLFTLENGNVKREALANGRAVFVWMVRQDAGVPALGGMGGPNHLWIDGRWQVQPRGAHMPSDVTRDLHGRLLWMTREGLRYRTADGYRTETASLPPLEYVPWYAVIDGLHNGLLIHPQWKWMNDVFALLALLLAGTGLWRWWRVKWV